LKELKEFTTFVEGIPKPQPRAKSWSKIRKGVATSGVYDPGTADDWKSVVALHLMSMKQYFEGPVYLSIIFIMHRPKKLMRKKDPVGRIWCATKKRNDVDNLAKAVMDVLTDMKFWEDDGQVCYLNAQKLYAAKEADPTGAHIRITEML